MAIYDHSPQAVAAYRAAFERTPGDWDAKDQAGFAAIERDFPGLTIFQQLDLLQAAQKAHEAEVCTRRAAA